MTAANSVAATVRDIMKAILIGILLIGWITGSASALLRNSQEKSLRGERLDEQAFRAPFSIADNATVILGPWHYRRMTIFIDSAGFADENLRSIFSRLSEKYPAEDLLEIDALSSEEAIKDKHLWFADILRLPFGNVAPNNTDDSPIGTLSARYDRGLGAEFFAFNPAAGETVHVSLKGSLCVPSGHQSDDLVDGSIRGCRSLVESTLIAGANPNGKSRTGGVPLFMASYWGWAEIAELLLNSGADINQASSSGWTPLIGAISGNRTSIIELLLRRGADINHRAEDGKTALSHAVLKQNVRLVADLLDRGAEISTQDGYGKTPLAIAEELHDQELIRILKKGRER